MTNLTDQSQWDAGVYQFETTDPVQGGAGGIDNLPHQALADRTRWLRDRIGAAITQAGLTEGATDNQQLAEAVVLHTATVVTLRAVPQPVVPNGSPVYIFTRGRATEGDKLGAPYRWVYSSIAADDGINTIQPTGVAMGRWIRSGVDADSLGGNGPSFYAGAQAVNTALAAKAPLNNANLTGNPTAPVPPAEDASQSLAVTEWVYGNFVPHTGFTLTWNSSPNQFYKIATLPPSAVNTADSITIIATLNDGFVASRSTRFEGTFGNRNGFTYAYSLFGPSPNATRIAAFQESDGSVSIYTTTAAVYGYAMISIMNSGVPVGSVSGSSTTVYPSPVYTPTLTGTEIFDSGAPATYPPLLSVQAPGTYLTSAIAAATYLPLAGGTLTGALTIEGALNVGGDIYTYRGGGTTGVIYLTSNGSHYVYFDGSNYQLPGGEVFANGYQLARLVSPSFQGSPRAPTQAASDASTLLATTAFVQSVVANYATNSALSAEASARATGDSNEATARNAAIAANGPEVRGGQFMYNAAPGQFVPFSPRFTNACTSVVVTPAFSNSNVWYATPDGPTGFLFGAGGIAGTYNYVATGN